MYIVHISLDFSTPIGYVEIQGADDQFCGPYTSIEEAVRALADKGLELGGFGVSHNPAFKDKGCPAASGISPNTLYHVTSYWVRIIELTQLVHPEAFNGYKEADYIKTIPPAS